MAKNSAVPVCLLRFGFMEVDGRGILGIDEGKI